IKSGQIKELEVIASDSPTGGRVHPKAKFIRKLKSGEEAPMEVGTTYTGGSGPADPRSFRIKSAGEGLGATLDIAVTGRLGKAWQPTFSSEPGGIVRVLLEREPAAEEEFWNPRGLLALSAPISGKTTFTWILGEGHPMLPMEDGEATEIHALAGFQETVTHSAKSGGDWRDFGTIIKWSFTPSTGPAFDLSTTLEEKGASAAARAFLAKGGLGNATAPARFPITTFVEKVDKNGEHSNEGEKQAGMAEASLVLIR
ncbi:MAG: hypothetical protein KDN05_20570, partial [Verrucomicrobiae bacterium]|nr:hypothetical protein [Verrucomicrobiae bacterium]